MHFPPGLSWPFDIDSINLDARGSHFDIHELAIDQSGNRIAVKGTVDHLPPKWLLALSVTAEDLDVAEVEALAGSARGAPKRRGSGNLGRLPLRGNIEVMAGRFSYGPFSWQAFHADISFVPDGLDIAVAQGVLCGIDTPGVVQITDDGVTLDLKTLATGRDVEPAVQCLRKGKVLATGRFDLSGHLAGRAKADALLEQLAGDMVLQARDGRIYRHVPLAKLLAYLNVIELFKEGIPDLPQEGFAYKSIHFTGKIDGGRFVIDEGIIDSPVMEIGCQGHVDLLNKTLDLDLLVAPLQAANYLIKKVPVVNQIMGGTLISIPLKMQGSLDDPEVDTLPLKMVSNALIGLLKRTLQLPIYLIEPMLPKRKP